MVFNRIWPALWNGLLTVQELQKEAERRIKFINKELSDPCRSQVPLRQRLSWYRRGFQTSSGLAYDFDTYPPEMYMNYPQKRALFEINDITLANYKYAFDRFIRQTHSEFLPELYAIIKDTSAFSPDGAKYGSAWDWVNSYISEGQRIVFKPDNGGGGEGVFIVSLRNGDLHINGETITKEEFASRLSGTEPYIAVEFVEQAEYSEDIYPHSTNTIRIFTMRDPHTGEPFVGHAMHRFGTAESRPTDNWAAGGLSVGIDIETGILEKGVKKPSSSSPQRYESHPDTDVKITGNEIPQWDKVKSDICDLADELYFMEILAWDVALTEGGMKVIEGNNGMGVRGVQSHRPMYADERAREFFRHYNVI